MNPVIEVIQNRKSVRAYLDKPILQAEKDAIINTDVWPQKISMTCINHSMPGF